MVAESPVEEREMVISIVISIVMASLDALEGQAALIWREDADSTAAHGSREDWAASRLD